MRASQCHSSLKFGDGYLVYAADFFPFSTYWCRACITRRPHACGVDVKVPSVGVFEKGRRERGVRGSASMMMALVLSGMMTLKTPPKKSHAASQASRAPSFPRRWDRRSGGASAPRLTPEGGKVLKKSSGKGPYVLRTDRADGR